LGFHSLIAFRLLPIRLYLHRARADLTKDIQLVGAQWVELPPSESIVERPLAAEDESEGAA
jgi:hypothetical protein